MHVAPELSTRAGISGPLHQLVEQHVTACGSTLSELKYLFGRKRVLRTRECCECWWAQMQRSDRDGNYEHMSLPVLGLVMAAQA